MLPVVTSPLFTLGVMVILSPYFGAASLAVNVVVVATVEGLIFNVISLLFAGA